MTEFGRKYTRASTVNKTAETAKRQKERIGQAHDMFSQIFRIRIYKNFLPNNKQVFLRFFSKCSKLRKKSIFEQQGICFLFQLRNSCKVIFTMRYKKTNNCPHFFLPITNNCPHFFMPITNGIAEPVKS